MYFASDNWAGAHPSIAASLTREAAGYAAAYGTSDLDKRIEAKFNEIFEREVAVFFVGTGTAANSLALASVARPGGISFCHFDAHVNSDEGGAPEFLSGASRLYPVEGADGKMDAAALAGHIARFDVPSVHHGRPMAITVTQATEAGTIYTLDEISAIGDIARSNRLPLHMDGARFANALVALDCSPAEMTWKRGIDILSFGGTKNGCWCAEAIVFFDPKMAGEMPYIRKRSAQLFSKTRFVSAQLEAYFEDDLWLKLAGQANAMADRLRAGIDRSNATRQAWQTTSNEVFAVVEGEASERAIEKGARFYDWGVPREMPKLLGPGQKLIRLVTSFSTSASEVDEFLSLIA